MSRRREPGKIKHKTESMNSIVSSESRKIVKSFSEQEPVKETYPPQEVKAPN